MGRVDQQAERAVVVERVAVDGEQLAGLQFADDGPNRLALADGGEGPLHRRARLCVLGWDEAGAPGNRLAEPLTEVDTRWQVMIDTPVALNSRQC